MQELLDHAVFTVGSEVYSWADVVAAAQLWGDWEELRSEVREGVACLKRLEEAGADPPLEEVEAAAEEFRYARDLISAEELETWLGRWKLTTEDWLGYLERRVLREKWHADLPGIVARYPVSREETERSLVFEAICSEGLRLWALKLAAEAVAYRRALEESWVQEEGAGEEKHARLRQLQEGYEKFRRRAVTERSIIALSGGQRQRIAIARALYHRPPVLIFDEATSSLDTESERAIQENMDQFLKGRTSFVIAHRLSTIRNADFIVVIEKGRLVEQGTHDELMQLQGLYYYLASQQLGS